MSAEAASIIDLSLRPQSNACHAQLDRFAQYQQAPVPHSPASSRRASPSRPTLSAVTASVAVPAAHESFELFDVVPNNSCNDWYLIPVNPTVDDDWRSNNSSNSTNSTNSSSNNGGNSVGYTGQQLTASNILMLNMMNETDAGSVQERLMRRGSEQDAARRSSIQVRGTATRCSVDSTEQMGLLEPWSTANTDCDSCIFAVGAWAEDIVRPLSRQ